MAGERAGRSEKDAAGVEFRVRCMGSGFTASGLGLRVQGLVRWPSWGCLDSGRGRFGAESQGHTLESPPSPVQHPKQP